MLEALQLGCRRGGRELFRDLSFVVRGGDLLRVTGPNGSGKTSLLRMLCGLLAPSAGEVRWQGAAVRGLREEYSRELVYLGHSAALKDDLTAGENLWIQCTLSGTVVSAAAVREALARFALPGEGHLVKRLSLGQRRRAALARLALSESRPLWLLDEPFAALDAAATRLAEALIGEHAGRGGAVIYTTHQESKIDSQAQRVSL